MKKFTVALTLIALFISTTFICGAKSAENLIKDEEKNSKAELKQIQELIDYDSEFLTSMMPSLNASVDKNQIKKSMKTDNACKQYRLNSVYIYDDYTKNGNFGSMISDDYNWIVPLYDENIYISFSKKSGSWQFGGAGSSLSFTDDDGNKLDLDFSLKGILKKLKKEKGITNADEIKYVSSDRVNFIYVLTDGTEYLIPYCSRPDFTELENGKIYTAGEALDIYNSDFPVQVVSLFPWEEKPALNGSMPVKYIYNYTPVYIAAAVLLLAAGVSVLIIFFKKRRTFGADNQK